MPFNPAEPQDTTKIRNLGSVIRDNWDGIYKAEDSFLPWAINLPDRQISVPGQIDPVAIPGSAGPPATPAAFILYCKEDVLGGFEFFGIDSLSQIIQFTSDGNIGSSATNFIINNFKFGSNATIYNAGNIVKARGSISSAGVLQAGSSNITSASKTATGNYTVNIAADVLEVGSKYHVSAICTSSSSGSNARTIWCYSKAVPVAAAVTAIKFYVNNASGAALIDESFDVIVTGGV